MWKVLGLDDEGDTIYEGDPIYEPKNLGQEVIDALEVDDVTHAIVFIIKN